MDDLSRGVESFNAGRFDEALRRFRAAAAAGQGVPEARVFIGHVWASQGRGAEAAAQLANVIADFPRHLPAYAGLANVVLRLSPARDAAAEKALLRLLTLRPGAASFRAPLAGALRACGEALRSVGELAAAERMLARAVALGRDATARRGLLEVGRRRAQSFLAAGDLRRAEEELRKTLALEPADEKARRALVGLLRRRALAHVSSGRLDEAEKSLRLALALAPRDPKARRQKLEVRSMRDKTEKARRKAARLARARKVRRLRDARRQLAEVLAMRERAALAKRRAESRARALAHEVPNVRGRLPEKRRAWRAVAKADPADGSARLALSLLARWIGTPEEERAELSLAVAKGSVLSRADRFRALMRLGRCREAARLGEEILDDGVTLLELRAFWDPWEKDNRPDREAPLGDARALRAAPAPWRGFYLGGALPRGPRYRFMHYNAAMEALFSGSFRAAVRSFRVALRGRPVDWRAHGYLAEAYACVDEPSLARREMARACAAAPRLERAQALAWRGELDLWLGHYDDALERTTRAAAGGSPFAHGWRGAALLKLGRREEALAQLDAALRLYPGDEEARLWRAEARRELGRFRESLADLELVTRQHRVWILFNRALAKRGLGDEAGMKADFEALPAEVAARAAFAAGPRAEIAEILEAGLRLGRGFRRGEYGQAVWLSRRGGP